LHVIARSSFCDEAISQPLILLKTRLLRVARNDDLFPLQNEKGIALIVVLLALVMITAMVIEFAYGVYTGTNNLYNWRDSQRLSVMAQSGVNVSARFLSDALKGRTYSYPGSMEFPVENPVEDFPGEIRVRIEDETAKFNLNSIVNARGEKNETTHPLLVRLLKNLSLDEKIADRILDWIDRDSAAELGDSEAGAKNAVFLSADELLLIHGISRKDYDTLLPYVTVYGPADNSLRINMNGAEKPVLMCLSDSITAELAQRVIEYRKGNPFQDTSELGRVQGFEKNLAGIPPGVLAVKGKDFLITSTASSGGVKRIIETVVDMEQDIIQYWKEY
jgi:general secretion pathway protein K